MIIPCRKWDASTSGSHWKINRGKRLSNNLQAIFQSKRILVLRDFSYKFHLYLLYTSIKSVLPLMDQSAFNYFWNKVLNDIETVKSDNRLLAWDSTYFLIIRIPVVSSQGQNTITSFKTLFFYYYIISNISFFLLLFSRLHPLTTILSDWMNSLSRFRVFWCETGQSLIVGRKIYLMELSLNEAILFVKVSFLLVFVLLWE